MTVITMKRLIGVLTAWAALAAAGGIFAASAAAAVPANTAPPSIGGTAREGQTLTASNGTWSNKPTTFAYQWQRCGTSGTSIVFCAVGRNETTNGCGVVPLTEIRCTAPAKSTGSVCTGMRRSPRTQPRRSQRTVGPVHMSPCQPLIDVDVRSGPSTR